MGITLNDHLIDSGHYDITPEQEREIEAREECARRGIDPDAECADGGTVAWMVVSKEIDERSAPLREARDRALEEAAKLANDQCLHWAGINADRYWQSHRLAGAIRALKEQGHGVSEKYIQTSDADLDWGQSLGLQTTVAMRARIRELSERPNMDDHDRAVLMLLDDFARCMVLLACASANTAEKSNG